MRIRLGAALAHRGYTIRRLSDEAAIPYKSLQNYLRGERAIPAEAVRRIAEILKVSADWLLSGQAAALSVTHVSESLDFSDQFGDAGTPTMALRQRAKAFMEWYQRCYADDWAGSPPTEPAPKSPSARPRRRKTSR
ncbi:helix-turn-helix domain-containing protein [Hypericibacter sp.]|uniref:helix-turn-helix domain-containing protein n=1 Tax=Hypericibacter sp. TaxID=2705401 RepID=UPI003D6D584F